ncbi:MAG: BMP family ABC transporter substrate-binding protein [Treponema sp.]|nr:BMP family ABC transporter substrate-binding protein [Treponema sp.]
MKRRILVLFFCVIAANAFSDSPVIVRLLTDASGLDDKAFNAAAWRGILEFYGDTWDNTPKRGRLYDVITAKYHDMYIPSLMRAASEGCDLIAAAGFMWADAIAEAANGNPGQKYMIVDVDWLDAPNVLQAVFAEHEGSFLVGAAAALKAKEDRIANPRFGFIGGVPGGVLTRFEVGYVQGILSVLPDAEIVDYYVNNWSDSASAKNQAKLWYDSGVYAIYSAAGGSGDGVIAQAREYRAAGRNVWAIGVDCDQYEDGLYNASESAVLTSMVKLVENSLLYALNAVRNNAFRGGIITFDLAKDGVGYTAANRALGNSIKNELERIRQRIIKGGIEVASTYAKAKRLPGFPQNLKARDD